MEGLPVYCIENTAIGRGCQQSNQTIKRQSPASRGGDARADRVGTRGRVVSSDMAGLPYCEARGDSRGEVSRDSRPAASHGQGDHHGISGRYHEHCPGATLAIGPSGVWRRRLGREGGRAMMSRNWSGAVMVMCGLIVAVAADGSMVEAPQWKKADDEDDDQAQLTAERTEGNVEGGAPRL